MVTHQEWEQETKYTEEMIPQLGNSNPVDSEDIHLDQVGSTMAELQTTSSVSIVPGRIDFSIASQLETMITEMSFKRFKKQALAHFAWVQAIMLAIAIEKVSSHVSTAERKTSQDITRIMW